MERPQGRGLCLREALQIRCEWVVVASPLRCSDFLLLLRERFARR